MTRIEIIYCVCIIPICAVIGWIVGWLFAKWVYKNCSIKNLPSIEKAKVHCPVCNNTDWHVSKGEASCINCGYSNKESK